MSVQHILYRINNLPLHVQQQLVDYIEFLTEKYTIDNKEEPPKQNDTFFFFWSGKLAHVDKTAIELQKEANRLR